MRKVLAVLIALTFVVSAGVLFAGGGGKETAAPQEKEEAEESKEYVAEKGLYDTFEMYRDYAKKEQPYPGSPGKGKKLGFAFRERGHDNHGQPVRFGNRTEECRYHALEAPRFLHRVPGGR